MSTNSGLSRRDFLLGTGGLTFFLTFPGGGLAKSMAEADTEFSAWINIGRDNLITIMSPAAELGQGSMTAVPMILAEELDADWDRVKIEFSPADDAIFKNPTSWVRGIMLTLGSSAVSGYFDTARLHGAQVRKTLRVMAAAHWQVPLAEVSTKPGMAVHDKTDRRLTYGEIVSLSKPPSPLPQVTEQELKPEAEFRIIGSDLPRYDIPDKVKGSPLYSIDVHLPGMLFAAVVHNPHRGAGPSTIRNSSQLKQLADIVDVVSLPEAVAVVATTIEAALEAEKLLDIEWQQVEKLATYSDRSGLLDHAQQVNNPEVKGMPLQQAGEINNAFATATKVYQAEYRSDYLYHAQLEPLNAVAHVTDNGKGVEVWAGTQAPTHCTRSVAALLKIPVEQVTLHRSYLGGAFGRRGAQDHDYVIDAVLLSKRMKAPVKAIWSREADVKSGRFKPIKAMRLQAAEDREGNLIAWHHRTASDEPHKQADPYRYRKNRGWPAISGGGISIDYDIENILAEMIDRDTGVRIAPLRGIGATINKFAAESFIDEIALAKSIDPYEFRHALLHKHPHAQKTLETVAEMANWQSRRPSDGLGLAFGSSGRAVSIITQVRLDRKTGIISVPKVWAALDVGIAVHPRNIIGQIEGQIIYSISSALKERITLTDGVVDQSNFHDYPVMRMAEIPEIEVELITRKNSKPIGVGDARHSPIPAAIGNGFTALTGKRLRHLPLIPERVLATLS